MCTESVQFSENYHDAKQFHYLLIHSPVSFSFTLPMVRAVIQQHAAALVVSIHIIINIMEIMVNGIIKISMYKGLAG